MALVLVFSGGRADGPGVGTPTVVTLGDSAISGEAGRWAGNTNDSYTKVDALGSTAYWDTPSGEAIAGCHRSKAAQAHIGGGVNSANLACSGAKTSTGGTGSGEDFKPGIDFYSDAQGRQGQALALQNYAATHNVKVVVVLIGANNYGFADIVTRCVTNWLTSPSWWKNYCSDDSDMTSRFTAARQATETTNVRNALLRRGAGDDQRRLRELAVHDRRPDLLVADPARVGLPLLGVRLVTPEHRRLRRLEPRRRLGERHRRADAAQHDEQRGQHQRPDEHEVSTCATALNGRRLCENTVGLLEEKGVASWTTAGAVDKTEWVAQIRTVTTIFRPYQLQEASHASYWGQKAMRNCLRQAYNGGAVRGGNCVRTANGLNARASR